MASGSTVSSRALVGLFVLVTLGILAWGTLQLGGYGFKRAEGYPLWAIFQSAFGVEPQTPVLIAGIKVGEVTEVELYNKQARVSMKFLKGVQIHDDAVATIKTAGIIGEKFIEIDSGSEDAPLLLPGQEIGNTASPPDFEKLTDQLTEISLDIKEITGSLRYALGSPESRESLRSTVLALERISLEVEGVLKENRDGVNDIVTAVSRLARVLEEQGPGLIENYNQVAYDAQGFMQEVSRTVGDIRPQVQDGIQRINDVVAKLDDAAADMREITAKVQRGEGTVGKLLNDSETAERLDSALGGVNELLRQVSDLKTSVHYRGEYRFNERNRNRLVPYDDDRAGGVKSYFGLKVQPREDKYYLFEIVRDPAGDIQQEKTIVRDANGNIVDEQLRTTIEDKIQFTAEIAKTFYGVTLHGGIIENTGGFGLDYALIDPNLKVAVQAYDFTNPSNPNLKAELDFYFMRHFFLTGGAEDIINRDIEPLYFGGGGFYFTDDDLKLLLSTLPTP